MLSLPGIKIEGGIPLTTPEGKIIGAIGVSGGNSMQDGMIAKAGADAFTKMMAH
jgi:glc operon protein GlcG